VNEGLLKADVEEQVLDLLLADQLPKGSIGVSGRPLRMLVRMLSSSPP
jgi:hypothetical protein